MEMQHSPQPSIVSSTTSDLLLQSKRNSALNSFQQGAEEDRSRLEEMMNAYKQESSADNAEQAEPASVTTNEDDYEDADDFIANKSNTHSQRSSISPQEHATPDQQQQQQSDTVIVTPPDDDFAFEKPPASPTDLMMNRRSMISEYAASIHEANPVEQPAARPSIVKISRASSKRHAKTKSNESSTTNTNSGSGSDSYPLSSYSGKDFQYEQQEPVIKEEDEKVHQPSQSVDSFDFDVGPLNTKKEHTLQPIEKESLTTIDPAIPSRSPRRPVSAIGMKSPMDAVLEYEKHSRRTKSEDIQGIEGLVEEINSSMNISEQQRNTSQPRPLPPPPVPEHRVMSGASRQVVEGDGFVTEDEDKKIKKKKRKSKKNFKKGHFNHDTLVTLLQATEGTLIGQEFQGLGLETQDKQLIERLVDSLSRLTADMIVDGERRDESVKRLNKAIKALEGF